MVWKPESKEVAGLNVTERYAMKTAPVAATIGVRYFKGEQRAEMDGTLMAADNTPVATFRTKAGRADLNDMPRLAVKPGEKYRITFAVGGESLQTATFTPEQVEGGILDIREKDLLRVPMP